MYPELVIFDCDGVLVDSEPVANRIFVEVLAEEGIRLGYAEARRQFTGLTLASCLDLVQRRSGRSLPAGFADRLQARTFAALERELQAVPGIHEALARIKIPFCVASSGEHDKMRLTLGVTGLLPYFEGRIFSASEVPRGKPHPDLFLHAAYRMGVDPRRVVVVEDSLPGVEAAKAGGMVVLGYVGKDGASPLRRSGIRLIEEMSRLPEELRSLARDAASG